MLTMKKLKSDGIQKVEGKPLFKPTATMEKFVEIAVQLGSDNVAEICRNTQVSESAYYQWKKNPEFSKWMNEYANSLIRGDGWKLQNIGMRKARQDHRYWESMQKIVGNIQDNGNQTNVQNNIVIVPSGVINRYGNTGTTLGTTEDR